MTTSNDFKKGMRLDIDGEPWMITDITRQTPSARGAATLVKAKVKNIISGRTLQKTWKAGELVKLADFELRPSQYLYDDGGKNFFFMDNETYDQFELPREAIESELNYILPNDEVKAVFFDGGCIGVELPNTMVIQIVRCDPAVRGDTVNNVTKPAELETGLELQVPMFVNEGTKIIVDTREGKYVKRA